MESLKQIWEKKEVRIAAIATAAAVVLVIIGFFLFNSKPNINLGCSRFAAGLVETNIGPIMVSTADNAMGQYLATNKYYKKSYYSLYSKIFTRANTVIEVGASYGYNCILMAKHLVGRGKVYAVEPRKDNYKLLLYNIKLSDMQNIIPINKALYSKAEQKLLEPSTTTSSYSLKDVKKAQVTTKTKFITVNTSTLDSLFYNLFSVDLLIIEAGGAELEVLMGGQNILQRSSDIIIIMPWRVGLMKEFSNVEEISNQLAKIGYTFWMVDANAGIKAVSIKELMQLEQGDIVITKNPKLL